MRGVVLSSFQPKIVSKLYESTCPKWWSSIAYKGGRIERDLLNKPNIPSIDLQNYGCPKAEKLVDNMVWLETCGKHLTSMVYQHCPKVEVEVCGLWLQKQIYVQF